MRGKVLGILLLLSPRRIARENWASIKFFSPVYQLSPGNPTALADKSTQSNNVFIYTGNMASHQRLQGSLNTILATATSYNLLPFNKRAISESIRRMSSSGLTHVDGEGKARMVDVSNKVNSLRTATAEGIVYVGPEVSALIKENSLKKGDVFTVSQLAGVIGAKKTSELIPLCHNIALSNVEVVATLLEESHEVRIMCRAKCHGRTGVEMEALTGVSVAALTVYDMCKAVTHEMVIKEIKLVQKSGGRREVYLIDERDI